MLSTASVARSLPFVAAARTLSVACALKSSMPDLTFDLTLPASPLGGCVFATAFGAAAVADFAVVLTAGLAVAGLLADFSAGAGLGTALGRWVSAIKMTPL